MMETNKNLTIQIISFHSHQKELHEKLTGITGSWERCVRGLKNAFDAKIKVTLNPVLTEITFRHFPEYIIFLHEEFPALKDVGNAVVFY